MSSPTVSQHVSGTISTGDTLTLTSWTPASDDLILVGVHLRDESITPTVSGNGLTFTLVESIVGGDKNVFLFQAQGAAPTTGSIVVTVTGNLTAAVAAAARISGAASIEESVTATSTDDAMQAAITTLTDNALVVAWSGHSDASSFTTPGDETTIEIRIIESPLTSDMWSLATTTAGAYIIGAASDLDVSDDWHLIAVSVAPVVPPTEVPGGRARYYLYDNAGRALGEIPAVTAANMSWGEHGPETATVTLPKRDADGSLNPWLHHTRLAPGGRAALIEIDARPDIPHVFLGKVKTAPDSSDAGTVAITAEGPWTWLNRIAVPAETKKRSAAGRIVRDIVASLRGWLRLDLGTYHEGLGLDVDLNGGSFWDTVTGLEGLTNERLYLTAVPRTCRLIADWHSQLGERWEGTLGVALESGVNCTWSSDNALDPDSEALIMVGQSFLSGASNNATVAVPPTGPVVGKRAALGAAFTSAVGAALGGGRQALRPDLVSRTAIEAAALADAQRNLTPTCVVTLRVLDLDLRAQLVPGCLVTVKLPDDAVGYFRNAVGQIQACDYSLEPEAAFTVTAELWAMDGDD